ncbi:uncharacterized protein I206_103370 [Kwoniella pini CBS 10737]|uniref:J domain-containing protein n=1 Tax=Kwoniella pini CBS 10737 TaxID=1296096 RepID=A0A1B9I9W8_9TREE|nr:uncharacterized protein I206_01625 [Kwoniella pini CBS 10737]OCF52336.1 hypothetical protein I206_01625 [Kwoniella pini CBS 10737]
MPKVIRLDQPTYYEILGIEEAAESCEDRNLHDPSAKDTFQQVQEAYEVLSDPERRTIYDDKLESLRNPPAPPCFSAYPGTFRPPSRNPARPVFQQPPPFHPLHGTPMMVPSAKIIWFKTRLVQRISSPSSALATTGPNYSNSPLPALAKRLCTENDDGYGGSFSETTMDGGSESKN